MDCVIDWFEHYERQSPFPNCQMFQNKKWRNQIMNRMFSKLAKETLEQWTTTTVQKTFKRSLQIFQKFFLTEFK